MKEIKKRGPRWKESYRWTDKQTEILLDNIVKVISEPDGKFERPTARIFYSKLVSAGLSTEIDWAQMKFKMRHLKSKYMKAKEWKDTIGSDLFDTNRTHFSERFKQLCPYYNKLDQIYGPMLNSDPIGIGIMEDENTADVLQAADEFTEDNYCESLETNLLVPKSEINHVNTNEIFDEPMSYVDELAQAPPTGIHSTNSKKETPVRTRFDPSQEYFENEWEKSKFDFEKEKFYLNYRLEREKLKFERDKFEFEKKKFFESQNLRKYEIDKGFEMKKMDIEKEERLNNLSET